MRKHVLLQKPGWRRFDNLAEARAEMKQSERRLTKWLDERRPNFRRRLDVVLAQPLIDPYGGSAFCRPGQFALERKLVPELAGLLSKVPGPVFKVTIVRPCEKLLKRVELAKYDWNGLKKSVLRALNQLRKVEDGVVAVGHIDFDLTANSHGKVRVRPHVHLLVVGASAAALKKHLRPAKGNASVPVKRPLKVVEASDQGALTYVLKTQLAGLRNAVRKGRTHNRKYPDANSKIAFDLFLLKHSQKDLMLHFGIRRSGSKYRLTRVLERQL